GSIPITRSTLPARSYPADVQRPVSDGPSIDGTSRRHMQPAEPLILGWREWLSLPALGIGAIKAKLDTGARTSSLSVVSAETFEREGGLHVRFLVRPRRRGERTVTCEAPVVDRRPVTDSGGHTGERWFIRTGIVLAGRRFETDINLTDRRAM